MRLSRTATTSAEGRLGRSVATATGVASVAFALGAPEAELELGEPHAATTEPSARIRSSTGTSTCQPDRMPYRAFTTSPFRLCLVCLDGGRRSFFAGRAFRC